MSSKTTNNCPALTTGQAKLLLMLSQGLGPAEIAALTFVSPRTIHCALYQMSKKLGGTNHIAWLNQFGTWTAHEDILEIVQKAETRGGAKSHKRKDTVPVPHDRPFTCVSCQRGCDERVRVGDIRGEGLWRVPMCNRCQKRLERVRTEARIREEQERKAEQEGRFMTPAEPERGISTERGIHATEEQADLDEQAEQDKESNDVETE